VSGATTGPAVAVLGAGAVGCYYGAMLARAGVAVTMVGRPAHVEAMQRDGLRLTTAAFDERVAVRAGTDASAIAGAALVLVCVKSTDTALAALGMRPHLAPGARVLSLQNGVDNAPRLAAALGVPVAPAVVYVASEMAGPGHVRHMGRGELVIPDALEGAAGLASRDVVALFARAGVPVETSANVVGALWAKLVLNCAYNALSAITDTPYGALVTRPGIEATMRDAVDECLAVAAALGVAIPGDVRASVARIAQTMPGQVSSTCQDLRRGKPSEIDHLNGHVAAEGARLGVATPVNRALHAIVKALEARRAA
jgi:2-dehydropantoate 2-reductase